MAKKKSTPTKNGEIAISADGDTLVITLVMDAAGRDSSTGKSLIHFTTSGYKEVPGTDKRVSLTVISSKKKG